MNLSPRRQHSTLSRTLNALAFLSSVPALLATAWIVLPAPAYQVWLLSVAASEWSLYPGALAAFGIVCGLLARARGGGGRRLSLFALVAGGLAVVFALYPLASAFRVARARGASLSLREYLSGLRRAEGVGDTNEAGAGDFKTYTYATIDGSALRLDAYLPTGDAAADEGAGVIVVHGGSWSGGERGDFPQWNRWFARQGFAVFDVDYRLAPQPNWQTATGDVKCAVEWIKRHAAQFRVSPQRLVLLGRSAGGHLALLAAYSAADARLPSSCRNTEGVGEPMSPPAQGEGVRGVVSFYAPTDLLWAFDHPANRRVIDGPATISRFVGGNPHESDETRERFLLASPVAHVGAGTPPTLLVHGGHDQLVRLENMQRLEGKLKEAGASCEAIFIPYAQHGFDYNFHGWGSQIVRTALLDFLRESTKPR